MKTPYLSKNNTKSLMILRSRIFQKSHFIKTIITRFKTKIEKNNAFVHDMKGKLGQNLAKFRKWRQRHDHEENNWIRLILQVRELEQPKGPNRRRQHKLDRRAGNLSWDWFTSSSKCFEIKIEVLLYCYILNLSYI